MRIVTEPAPDAPADAATTPVRSGQHEEGIALIVLMMVLALWSLSFFVGQLNARQLHRAAEQKTARALLAAKLELIADGALQPAAGDAGYLTMPDIGHNVGGTPTEGQAAGNFAGNAKDRSVLGRFPWRTLDTGPLRDTHGECLWYLVSGRFKNATQTDVLNWDTAGQIDVVDGRGTVMASNAAALVIAAGARGDGQQRALADAAYAECAGNYDARNYLDPADPALALAAEPNYFAGAINGRVASSTANKRFVVSDSAPYNDQMVTISGDEIFDQVMRRGDFALAIGQLLDDPDLRLRVESGHSETVTVSSGAGMEKGTANLDCNHLSSTRNRKLCRNWKEMLFLTAFAAPTAVEINGVGSTPCQRVLLFAGRKNVGQRRDSAAAKADKTNYLDPGNAASFAVPTAGSSVFSGASTFDWRRPGDDLIRCLP